MIWWRWMYASRKVYLVSHTHRDREHRHGFQEALDRLKALIAADRIEVGALGLRVEKEYF